MPEAQTVWCHMVVYLLSNELNRIWKEKVIP